MDAKQVTRPLWAYAYEIVPPQPEDRLRTIRALIEHEHWDAQLEARTWRGNVVAEQQVTHILVVSDGAEQDREINRKLAAELKQLNVGFLITAPMAVADDATPGSGDAVLTKSSLEKEKPA